MDKDIDIMSFFPYSENMFLSGLIRLAAKVEKNRACVKLRKELEPSQCIFPDILKLVETPGDSDNWTPSKLKLVKEAYCAQHNKMQLSE